MNALPCFVISFLFDGDFLLSGDNRLSAPARSFSLGEVLCRLAAIIAIIGLVYILSVLQVVRPLASSLSEGADLSSTV